MTEKAQKQQLTSAVSLIREGKLSFYAVNQNFKLWDLIVSHTGLETGRWLSSNHRQQGKFSFPQLVAGHR